MLRGYGEINRKFSFILVGAYLCFVFLAGACGIWLAYMSRGSYILLARQLPSTDANILMLIMRSLIPLGLTYLLIQLRCRHGIVALMFIKTALLLFACSAFYLAYPQAGWLILLLMMTPDCVIAGLYHWLWLRCFAFKDSLKRSDLYICFSGIAAVLLFELFIISPFTASLFTKM